MALSPLAFLTIGLPGAGKTTRARELAAEHGALRLTPDDWMAPLFGDSDAGGKRDVLEGRLLWVAREVVTNGGSVVVDFGCWSPEERWGVRALAETAGARFELVSLEVEETERRARCARRWREAPETTFAMTDADHDRFVAGFTPPSPAELSGSPVPPPPAPYDDWVAWAEARWPTLGQR